MITDKEIIHISKFLSLVLRHQPELIGLSLNSEGWANVNDLLKLSEMHGRKITHDMLNTVVATNSKKRFAFSDDHQMIRASQGHSIEVALGYEPQQPPEILFHGTGSQSVSSILETGLQKKSRQHVHLSADTITAINVGRRHGKPVILEILAGKMHQEGYLFFLSANDVWLTEHVPSAFIRSLN